MAALHLHDTFNLLSKLTAKRVWNATKVISSFYISKWTGKPVQWGLPISASFEPTTSCNLRCPECPSGMRAFTRPTGMLNNELFEETIDQLSAELVYLIFYFQGEPYLNPDFLTMVKHASSRGIYTATSTNAHYLNDDNARKTVESGLDRLIISIDGTSQEVYQQYRVGGKIEKVIEGAKNVVAWKRKLRSRTPHIFFQFLVVKPNEHQVADIKLLAKECGVDDVRFKTAQIYDHQNDPHQLIPQTARFSRYYKDKNGTSKVKNALPNHCWRLWQGTVITWDGLVVPCCFDKDATHRMGSLKDQSFREIWQHKEYRQFRKQMLISRRNIDICANCSEGTKVWSD